MAKNLKANLLTDQIISVLGKFMIFDKLTPREIREILSMESSQYKSRIAKLCLFKAGETVINEGDFDCWSFWVVKGVFEVIQAGKPLVRFKKPGEIFGEMSVLEGIPRTASVISVTDSVCLCIDMSVIDNMGDRHIRETVKEGFYRVILKRLNRTKGKMMKEKQHLECKYADLLDFEQKIREKAGK